MQVPLDCSGDASDHSERRGKNCFMIDHGDQGAVRAFKVTEKLSNGVAGIVSWQRSSILSTLFQAT